MQKKKEEKESYATDDPTNTTAEEQENLAKEAIRLSQTFISNKIFERLWDYLGVKKTQKTSCIKLWRWSKDANQKLPYHYLTKF